MESLYTTASFACLMWEKPAADESQGTNLYSKSQRHATDTAHCLNNVSLLSYGKDGARTWTTDIWITPLQDQAQYGN